MRAVVALDGDQYACPGVILVTVPSERGELNRHIDEGPEVGHDAMRGLSNLPLPGLTAVRPGTRIGRYEGVIAKEALDALAGLLRIAQSIPADAAHGSSSTSSNCV